ncbi:MAG: enolase C-terminal domain-like protein [Rhizobiaceae bacterium]
MEAFNLPVAPHDCVGLVTLVASTHLLLKAPNALVQETVRAFYTGWYKEIIATPPVFENGYALPMAGAGLGTTLMEDRFKASDAVRIVSRS